MSTAIYLLVVAGSTILALLLSLLAGEFGPVINGITCLVALGGGFFCFRRGLFASDKNRSWHFAQAYFYPVSLIVFVVVYYQWLYLMYPMDRELHFGNANNLGDLPMHINNVKAFARGLHFWPENLEFSGERLRYPFGLDLFSGFFESWGIPTRVHFFILGLLGTYFLFRELYTWGGVFLLVAFFFNGGFVDGAHLLSGEGAWPGPVDFKNLFLSCVVTQRTLLFALPAGIFILRQFLRPHLSKLEQGALVFLLATIPLFHLHTFAFLVLYLAGRLVLQWFKDPATAKSGAARLLLALVLASPLLVAMLSGSTQVGQALALIPVWNSQTPGFLNKISYLFTNFGIFIPIWLILVWLGIREKKWPLLWSASLFLIFLFVRVAPWPWDNIKVLMWAYLICMVDFHDEVLHTMKIKKPQMILMTAALLLCFAPGFAQWMTGLPVFGRSVLVASDQYQLDCAEPNFSINDVVVVKPDFAQPLLWSGVKMAMGYEGHVWAHGYALEPRLSQVNSILQGSDIGQEAAKKLNAKWIYATVPMTGEIANWSSRVACLSKPNRGDRLYEIPQK